MSKDWSIHETELEKIINNSSNNSINANEKIDVVQPKRIPTADVKIRNFGKIIQMQKNVFKPSTPRRDGFETARTARKFVNNGKKCYIYQSIDTNREIMGNVWINDLHHKEKDQLEHPTSQGEFIVFDNLYYRTTS